MPAQRKQAQRSHPIYAVGAANLYKVTLDYLMNGFLFFTEFLKPFLMEAIIGKLDSSLRFDFERFVADQYEIDFTGEAALAARQKAALSTGPERTIVCRHWLKGLCKKGDNGCEFLHEYNLSKMPECWSMMRFGACPASDCIYTHSGTQTIATTENGTAFIQQAGKECPWYSRGFCKHGPNCKNRHIRRQACLSYLLEGFCPLGPKCTLAHPKFETPQYPYQLQQQIIIQQIQQQQLLKSQ